MTVGGQEVGNSEVKDVKNWVKRGAGLDTRDVIYAWISFQRVYK